MQNTFPQAKHFTPEACQQRELLAPLLKVLLLNLEQLHLFLWRPDDLHPELHDYWPLLNAFATEKNWRATLVFKDESETRLRFMLLSPKHDVAVSFQHQYVSFIPNEHDENPKYWLSLSPEEQVALTKAMALQGYEAFPSKKEYQREHYLNFGIAAASLDNNRKTETVPFIANPLPEGNDHAYSNRMVRTRLEAMANAIEEQMEAYGYAICPLTGTASWELTAPRLTPTLEKAGWKLTLICGGLLLWHDALVLITPAASTTFTIKKTTGKLSMSANQIDEMDRTMEEQGFTRKAHDEESLTYTAAEAERSKS